MVLHQPHPSQQCQKGFPHLQVFPPYLSLVLRPSTAHARKRVWLFWATFLVAWDGIAPRSESSNQILERIIIHDFTYHTVCAFLIYEFVTTCIKLAIALCYELITCIVVKMSLAIISVMSGSFLPWGFDKTWSFLIKPWSLGALFFSKVALRANLQH